MIVCNIFDSLPIIKRFCLCGLTDDVAGEITVDPYCPITVLRYVKETKIPNKTKTKGGLI